MARFFLLALALLGSGCARGGCCACPGRSVARTTPTPTQAAAPGAAFGPELEVAVAAAKREGVGQFIYDETYASNIALQKCLFDAGSDEAKQAACAVEFEARMRRMVETVRTMKGAQGGQAVARSRTEIILTLFMAGRYEDQPGFLHIGWPEAGLTGYNFSADSRGANFEEISRRFEALSKAQPGASVHLIVGTDLGDLNPVDLAEVESRLRAAGFTRISVSYEALSGKPLNRKS